MKIRRIAAGAAALMLCLASVPTAAFAAEEKGSVRVAIANNTFSKEDGAAWDGVLLNAEVNIDEDSTMLSVIREALESNGYTISAPESDWGAYISDINGVGETTYAVKENYYPGWNLELNQWFTNQGVSAYTVKDGTLKDGDFIGLEYAITGTDVRNDYLSNDTSVSEVYINGQLFEDFSSDKFEYDITLSDESLNIDAVQNNCVFQTRTYLNTYSPETEGLGFRPQDVIEVADGDTVYVGVGNSSWPSSYWGSDEVTESVYKFNIHLDTTESDDLAAAQTVIDLIDSIGEINRESLINIFAAQSAYLMLTEKQQQLVTNIDKLEDAIEKYRELYGEIDPQPQEDLDDIYKAVINRLSDSEAVLGNEWKAIGLAVSGEYSESLRAEMIKKIAEYAQTAVDGKLDERRCTENAKEAITAAALGYDPTDIGGVDLLAALADKDYVSKQGITGYIWANIAYMAVGREAPYTDELLSFRLDNGAFSYDGETADVDITAMVLTALRGQKNAEQAVIEGYNWLLNADYKSSESISQFIIALSSNAELLLDNVDGLSEINILMQISDYYLGNGEFAHVQGGSFDGMATEQALLALTAAKKASGEGHYALYDFTNTKLIPYEYIPYVIDDTSSEDDTSGDSSTESSENESSAASSEDDTSGDSSTESSENESSAASSETSSQTSQASSAAAAGTNSTKNANPATAGGLAGGLFVLTAASAAIAVSRRKH